MSRIGELAGNQPVPPSDYPYSNTSLCDKIQGDLCDLMVAPDKFKVKVADIKELMEILEQFNGDKLTGGTPWKTFQKNFDKFDGSPEGINTLLNNLTDIRSALKC